MDIDAIFQPEAAVMEVAAELAGERNLPPDWLNSDAKGLHPVRRTRALAATVQGGWRHCVDRPVLTPGRQRRSCPNAPQPALQKAGCWKRDTAEKLALSWAFS
jgi:hypothetical protein